MIEIAGIAKVKKLGFYRNNIWKSQEMSDFSYASVSLNLTRKKCFAFKIYLDIQFFKHMTVVTFNNFNNTTSFVLNMTLIFLE